MAVYYYGDNSDNGVMNIQCYGGYYACLDLNVNADNIETINVECTGYSSTSYYICSNTVINANYSSQATLSTEGRYASNRLYFYVEEAGDVFINAQEGYRSFYYN